MAGSAGGYQGGRACHLRVNNDHGCRLCAAGLHSRAGRVLLPALRPDGELRADCLLAGCADRSARPGRVPPAPRRPARGRRRRGRPADAGNLAAADVPHHPEVGAGASCGDAPCSGRHHRREPGPDGHHPDQPLRRQRGPLPANPVEPAAGLRCRADHRSRHRDRNSNRRTVRRVHGEHRRR